MEDALASNDWGSVGMMRRETAITTDLQGVLHISEAFCF